MQLLQSFLARQKIKKLFEEDKKDRSSESLRELGQAERMKFIDERDQKRIDKLEKILEGSPKLMGIDCFRAGIIYQHGPGLESIKKARDIAKKGADLGDSSSAWLHAAATDRMNMWEGKKQKFGTQFTKKDGRWVLYSTDTSTTDEVRAKYNVMPMSEILRVLDEFNENPKDKRFTKTIGLTKLR